MKKKSPDLNYRGIEIIFLKTLASVLPKFPAVFC